MREYVHVSSAATWCCRSLINQQAAPSENNTLSCYNIYNIVLGEIMTYSSKKQRGLTFLSILFILGLLAFFVLLTLKIAPIYMNHSKVVNSLAAVESMPDVETLSKREILNSLNKRFNMNYVENVDKRDIEIIKQGNYVKVEIVYERVEKILGNLSVLVQFEESFEAGDTE